MTTIKKEYMSVLNTIGQISGSFTPAYSTGSEKKAKFSIENCPVVKFIVAARKYQMIIAIIGSVNNVMYV
jgi:protein involved in ribonucleotide reduction